VNRPSAFIRQMCDNLRKIKNLLDHPVLFAVHIIVYLTQALRYSRHWARLLRNIHILDTFLTSRSSHRQRKTTSTFCLTDPVAMPHPE
jgi:hypothetical protein